VGNSEKIISQKQIRIRFSQIRRESSLEIDIDEDNGFRREIKFKLEGKLDGNKSG
jgi:hypothetical protein